MPAISSLHIYPVKSLQGISLPQAALTMQGLAFDRQWMLVDAEGKFVTQRQLPALARIRVRLTAVSLELGHAGLPPLSIPLEPPPAMSCEVQVWRDVCAACEESADASHWLTQAVGQWQGHDLRLVRFAPGFIRPVDPAYMDGARAETAFSDGYPFLIVSKASLDALNMQLQANGADAVPMERFRPNIVLSGLEAFGENACKTLTAAHCGYSLAIRKPCQRCKITTIDQHSGLIGDPKEPLRTLAAMNPYPHLSGAYFGQNATLTTGDGALAKVGDLLEIHM